VTFTSTDAVIGVVAVSVTEARRSYTIVSIYLSPSKEEVNAFARVCLSVCLSARLLKNACMDLDEMLHVDRCRDVDELINF